MRDWLAAEGWNDVFLDFDPEIGIAPGERWERALNEAAARCEAVLFLISRHWLQSRWCLKEFNLARKLNKRLLGALIDDIPVSDLPADLTASWQLVDLASGQDHAMFRVTLPRTHQEGHVTFSKEGLARLRAGLTRAGLDPRFFPWPPERDPDRAPYRGLKPLESEDAGIFFGRDAPIIEALDAMRGLREGAAPRLLVILGASGAGKSSFLRAGLMPRLARDDRNFLPLPVIRPERAALSGDTALVHALEMALARHGLPQPRASLRAAVGGGADGLRPILQRLIDKVFATLSAEADAQRPIVVLAIDQAEELFAAQDNDEGEALLRIVHDLVRQDRPGVLALFTIRSDAYDRLETAKALEGLRQQTLPLLPMPRGAYQTVIESPAARMKEAKRNLEIEPGLTQRLLEDIDKGGGSDALPLLAFTLEQLYLDYSGRGTLALSDYETFGGIRGAIEAAVARALKAADNDARIPRDRDTRLALLRRGLIPWLAGIDPETGSPRRRVARRADIPDEAAPLVDLLVQQRLLATDRIAVRDDDTQRTEITVEPAHEALLRQWSLLHGWLQEDFAALTTLEGVKHAARDWAANGRRKEWLNHAGTRLEDAEKIAQRDDLARDLSRDARDYLSACGAREQAEQAERAARAERDREEQDRRLRDAQALAAANRRIARRTGAGLVAALVLVALVGWMWQIARTQRARADLALASATATTNELTLDLAKRFRDRIGMPIDIVRQILDRAQDLQDKLLAAGEAAPQLRYSAAQALNEVALTLLEQGDVASGADTKSILAIAERFRSIARGLLAEQPNNGEWRYLLSLSESRIGEAQMAAGEYAEALAAFRRGFDIREQLLQIKPDNAEWKAGLAMSNVKIADALLAIGGSDNDVAADTAYKKGLALAKEVAEAGPSVPEHQRELALSYERIGSIELQFGHPDVALDNFQRALEIRQQLRKTEPDNAIAVRDLAVTYNLIGDAALDKGDAAQALKAFYDELEQRKQLALENPSNQAQRDLAVSLSRIGDAEMELDRRSDAIDCYRQSLKIREELAQVDPDNTIWQTDLVSDLHRLAKAGDAPRARLSRALEIAKRLRASGRLRGDQANWIDALEKELAQATD